MPNLRLFLGDDHQLFRHGLRRLLEEQTEWQVVGEACDGRESVRLVLDLLPDVAILDIGMPSLNGIEAAAQITRRAPDVRVLMLSMYQDEAHVTRALKAGASGYLLKDSADTELKHAVAMVASGKSYFSPAVARILLDDYVRQMTARGVTDRYETLSEREREIFQLIVEGKKNREVAELLSVSPATVETHRGHILQKLDLHSTAELVLYAVRRGIIS